jgi:hypothetical protein
LLQVGQPCGFKNHTSAWRSWSHDYCHDTLQYFRVSQAGIWTCGCLTAPIPCVNMPVYYFLWASLESKLAVTLIMGQLNWGNLFQLQWLSTLEQETGSLSQQ